MDTGGDRGLAVGRPGDRVDLLAVTVELRHRIETAVERDVEEHPTLTAGEEMISGPVTEHHLYGHRLRADH